MCFLISIFLLAGCAGPQPYIIQEPPLARQAGFIPSGPGPAGMYHQVEAGQTLWRISKNYGLSVDEVLSANTSLTEASRLDSGSRIFIPAKKGRLSLKPQYVCESKPWRYIIVHHSATDAGSAEAFTRGHLKRGWNRGLGYDFVIDNGTGGTDDGDIEVGRRWFYQLSGAHCDSQGMNSKAIGICLVGNFDKAEPTTRQMEALASLVGQLRRIYDIPLSNIKRHRDIPGEKTDCPGMQFPWAEFKQCLTP